MFFGDGQSEIIHLIEENVTAEKSLRKAAAIHGD